MLTAKQAAIKLGISDRRVRTLAKQGRIPGAKIIHARTWIFPDNVVVTSVERSQNTMRKAAMQPPDAIRRRSRSAQ